jgi:hypothetical protein
MDGSLDRTKACLEQTEENQGKVETMMEVCLEEMKVETIRASEDRSGDQQPAVVSQNPLRRRTKDDILGTTEGCS